MCLELCPLCEFWKSPLYLKAVFLPHSQERQVQVGDLTGLGKSAWGSDAVSPQGAFVEGSGLLIAGSRKNKVLTSFKLDIFF